MNEKEGKNKKIASCCWDVGVCDMDDMVWRLLIFRISDKKIFFFFFSFGQIVYFFTLNITTYDVAVWFEPAHTMHISRINFYFAMKWILIFLFYYLWKFLLFPFLSRFESYFFCLFFSFAWKVFISMLDVLKPHLSMICCGFNRFALFVNISQKMFVCGVIYLLSVKALKLNRPNLLEINNINVLCDGQVVHCINRIFLSHWITHISNIHGKC